ncbi:hypothetical protein V8E53_014189 [Lactarius tabidus]
MRVSAPRFSHFVHLLSVNPAAAFMPKTMFASLRRRRDSFDTRTVLPSPTSPDSDAKFDVETVPDDTTLVESRRQSTHPDDDDSIFSDVREDEVFLKSKHTEGDAFISSKLPGKPALHPIIYPLPSAEDLLAYGRTAPSQPIDAASVTPLFCISRALSPPPTHYKRKRARIIPSTDHDFDPDQTALRGPADSHMVIEPRVVVEVEPGATGESPDTPCLENRPLAQEGGLVSISRNMLRVIFRITVNLYPSAYRMSVQPGLSRALKAQSEETAWAKSLPRFRPWCKRGDDVTTIGLISTVSGPTMQHCLRETTENTTGPILGTTLEKKTSPPRISQTTSLLLPRTSEARTQPAVGHMS